MIIKDNNVYIKAHLNKMGFDASFVKRMFTLAAWLNKRYDFKAYNIQYDHGFLDDDYANNLITIRFTFHEDRRTKDTSGPKQS